MIIKGIARFYGGKRNHLITTVTVRHPAVDDKQPA